MPDLILELLSEEIPARMQARAAADLERLMNERLLGAGFMPEGVKAFAGPRRLALVAAGLPGRQPDRKEEKKGPRVGAPDKAVEGFLKSAGLSSLDQCEVRDDKKGQYYVAVVEEKGRETASVIAGIMPEIVRAFPWPKSMRWGGGDLRWVRPLKSILCCFDGEVVDFEIDGIKSGNVSRGHRFLAPAEFRARTFDKYEAGLRAGKVVLDAGARAALIEREAKTLCEAQGLELVEDRGLLAEVAGLSEWPVPMMGAFDEKFLAVPDEVLTASMRGHQKYFSVRDPKTGRLANRFVYVANIEAPDAGKAMREGYERVLTARLSDAWYLYHQDLKTKLGERVADLDRITFFEGLGTVGDKAKRVAALAREIAPSVGADPALAEKAALLAKADLVTAMVREFPELQGVMGRYYYLEQAGLSSPVYGGGVAEGDGGGEAAKTPSVTLRGTAPPHAGEQEARAVADAIRDHYKPQGADDDVPTAPVSVAVALADKIDTLSRMWWVAKPTGSGDPFALRRAALGVIRIIVSARIRLGLIEVFRLALKELPIPQILPQLIKAINVGYWRQDHGLVPIEPGNEEQAWKEGIYYNCAVRGFPIESVRGGYNSGPINSDSLPLFLVQFVHERLKVFLKDQGNRHDRLEAVIFNSDSSFEDDICRLAQKLNALNRFLESENGANLLIGFRRAFNILKAEELIFDPYDNNLANPFTLQINAPPVNDEIFQTPEEATLFKTLKVVEETVKNAVASENFQAAMSALASLRAPIDAFFDKVTVNADKPELRENRLALLARFRAATAEVADLSKLEG